MKMKAWRENRAENVEMKISENGMAMASKNGASAAMAAA